MSEYFMYLFPAHPHQPKPNWSALRSQLLERGFMIEPRGKAIPSPWIWHVWWRLAEHQGFDRDIRNTPGSFSLILQRLEALGLWPRGRATACDRLSFSEFFALLRDQSNIKPGFDFDAVEEFAPGPLFHQLSTAKFPGDMTAISFGDSGDDIGIWAGENIAVPPRIPGTDRVVENWTDFISRWVKYPDETWLDEPTGRRFGLLDLDWENTLGAGKCALTILYPNYLDGMKAVALLEELTGIPFRFSNAHL